MTLANFPTTRPSFTANFARSQQLPPQVTFSRSSTGTYVSDNGLVQTAANNTPRFTWENGKCQGLLIEQQSTNVLEQSQALATTPWTYSNNSGDGPPTVTNNSGIAPDGTNTATKIDYVGISNAYQNWLQQYAVTSGYWTFSFYVKAATTADVGKIIRYQIYKGGTPESRLSHTLTNEWVRVSVPQNFASGISGNAGCQIEQMVDQGAMSCLVWGAQCEQGRYLSSYIPTASGTATRSPDLVSITGTDFSSWWNSSEGSIVTVADNFPTDLGNRKAWEFNDGSNLTPSGPTLVSASGSNNTFFQSPVNGNYGNATISFSTTSIKTAFAFTTNNDIAGSGDGSATQTNTSGVDPDVATVNIGRARSGASEILNGTIASIYYYPTRVSNNALEALTQ